MFSFAGCNLTWDKKIQHQHFHITNAGTFWKKKSYRSHGGHGNFTSVTPPSANGCSTVSVIDWAALRLHTAAFIATLELILHCFVTKIFSAIPYRITPAFIRLTFFSTALYFSSHFASLSFIEFALHALYQSRESRDIYDLFDFFLQKKSHQVMEPSCLKTLWGWLK